jgi:hypothetical protein
VPRERILEALRHVLDRPQMADLVIPDLARWEDWSQIDRLVRLFKDADEQSSWVRVPVINYLRACPKPEAAAKIEELKKIDPDAVKRADAFFPFSGGSSSADSAGESPAGGTDDDSSAAEPSPPRVLAPIAGPASLPELPLHAPVAVATRSGSLRSQAAARVVTIPTNPFATLGVFWIVGAVVMFAQWRILAGAGRR